MAVATIIRNTAAGYTTPLQWTDSAGGTAVTWWTPQLQATTLSGMIQVVARGIMSSDIADACISCEVAVVASDGSGATTYGIGKSVKINLSFEGIHTIYIAGVDTSIAQGNRLRIRLSIDDSESTFYTSTGAMGSGYTATLYFNGTSGGSGDTYLHLPITLTEYVATTPFPTLVTAPHRWPRMGMR